MRQVLLSLAAATLVVAPLSAAEAATSRYSVSATSSDRTLDLTSADGSGRSTVIKGKVKGGSVKGKKVYLYASNTSAQDQAYRYIGSDRLSSSGRFAKKWKPKDGGTYLVRVVKKAGSGKAEGSDLTRVRVYQFTNLVRFLDPASAAKAQRVDKAGTVGGQRWSTALELAPGSTTVFNTQGYRCFQVNFKIGVADNSRGGAGSFAVAQAGRSILSGSHAKGQRFIEPTRSQRKQILDDRPVTVSISGDASFILGNPKALCTYPTRSTPVR